MKTVRAHLFMASALALTVVATPFAQAGGQGGRPGMPARGGNMPQPARLCHSAANRENKTEG